MVGCDLHLHVPPEPLPPTPVLGMDGVGASFDQVLCGSPDKAMGDITVDGFKRMFQQDASLGLVVHIPMQPVGAAHTMLQVLQTLTSKSTNHVAKYSVQGHRKALATTYDGTQGIHANCSTPFSLPSGETLSFSSVTSMLTQGDEAASLCHYALSAALSSAIALGTQKWVRTFPGHDEDTAVGKVTEALLKKALQYAKDNPATKRAASTLLDIETVLAKSMPTPAKRPAGSELFR